MSAPKVHNYSTYVNHRCRCGVCQQANTDYNRQARARRKAELTSRPDVAPHGSNNTYINYGCRCAPCTAAHSARSAEYVRRRKAAS